MKKTILRILAVVCVLGLMLTGASAAVLGEAVRNTVLPLSSSLSLGQTTWYDSKISKIQKENVLTYTPGTDALPYAVYGETLYGRSRMDTIEDYPENWGFSVLAGVNGSFFDFDTGLPYGCVITDGCVRTSGDFEAVGFKADGTAIIGKPELTIALSLPGEHALANIHCNKELTDANGVVLYTRDFDESTKAYLSAYNVILQPENADLRLNSEIVCTVQSIDADNDDCPIPEGCFLLAMSNDTDYPATLETYLKPLAVGDQIKLTVSVNENWKDVVSACAGMEMLVENSVPTTSFKLSGADGRTARSAIGITAEGKIIVYTVDGVEPSAGLKLKDLAVRMKELGCVTALNLDGGGSTAIRARLPGKHETETLNEPQDGFLRRCANFIFMLKKQEASGAATKLFANPAGIYMLPGGSVDLSLTATDDAYNPATLPQEISWQTDSGTINGNTFNATTVGDATIRFSGGGASGSVVAHVLAQPHSIKLINKETEKEGGCSVKSEGSVEYEASALWGGDCVFASPKSFTWTCDSEIGTIDENGLFTAVQTSKPLQGEITCAVGDVKKSVTISVLADEFPFADAREHWAKDDIQKMYEKGVIKGSEKDGVLLFSPDDPCTRAQTVTFLWRANGSPEPTETENPFTDVSPDAYYYKAVLWAVENEITTGTSETTFSPDRTVDRAQVVTFLWRNDGAPGSGAVKSVFIDVLTGDYFWDAVYWADIHGVTKGTSPTLFSPKSPCTRAQIATFLSRAEAENQ